MLKTTVAFLGEDLPRKRGVDRKERPATVFRRPQGSVSAVINEQLWAASAGYNGRSVAGLSLAEEDLPEAQRVLPAGVIEEDEPRTGNRVQISGAPCFHSGMAIDITFTRGA